MKKLIFFGLIVILSITTVLASRLPNPNSDLSNWGNILNDFLNVSHYQNGTLKLNSSFIMSWNTTFCSLYGNVTNNNQLANGAGYITVDTTINNCSVSDSCGNILYETELDDESELEAQLTDVSDVYTDNDFSYADYLLIANAGNYGNVTNNNQLTNGAGYITVDTTINNCSVSDSCGNILYETELDDESELEAQLTDVSDVYTDNDFSYADYLLIANAGNYGNVTNNNQLANGAGYITVEQNPTNATITIPESQISDLGSYISNNTDIYITNISTINSNNSIGVLNIVEYNSSCGGFRYKSTGGWILSCT